MSGDAGRPHPGPLPVGEGVEAVGAAAPNTAAVDLSLVARVDDVCDRFEAACKGPAPPRLEDFVRELPLSAEQTGFRELLELELVYRRKAGQRPAIEEYRSRFPQFTATIDSIFGRALLPAPPPVNKLPGPALPTPARQLADTMLADDPRAMAASPPETAAGAVGTSTSSGLRFRVLRPHAKGGLGEVFVAEDQELHREVALKQIQARYADDTDSRSRFVARSRGDWGPGASGHRPGLRPGHAIPTAGRSTRCGSSTATASKTPLRSSIRRKRAARSGPAHARIAEAPRPLHRRVRCDEYAHSRRIVHRDLKPGNIMLGEFRRDAGRRLGAGQVDRPADRSAEELEPKSIHAPLIAERNRADADGLGRRHAAIHEPRASRRPTWTWSARTATSTASARRSTACSPAGRH